MSRERARAFAVFAGSRLPAVSDTVPYGVGLALTVLSAPATARNSMRTLDAWAQDGIVVPMRCPCLSDDFAAVKISPTDDDLGPNTVFGDADGTEDRGDGVVHDIRVDPYTFESVPAVPDGDDEQVDAGHMLWALARKDPLPCTRVGPVLGDYFGTVIPHSLSPMVGAARMLAVRTVGRAVQYRAAGLDPATFDRWIQYGARPRFVRDMWDLVAAQTDDPTKTLLSFEDDLFIDAIGPNRKAARGMMWSLPEQAPYVRTEVFEKRVEHLIEQRFRNRVSYRAWFADPSVSVAATAS